MNTIDHLSVSQAGMLEKCPALWKAIYLDKTQERDPTNVYQAASKSCEHQLLTPEKLSAYLAKPKIEALMYPDGRVYKVNGKNFKKGDPKKPHAEFLAVDNTVRVFKEKHQDLLRWMVGDYEVEVHEAIHDLAVLGYIDVLHQERDQTWIIDLKCLKNLDDEWNHLKHAYEPWWRRYVMQLVIYRELYNKAAGEWAKIGIVVCTKENPPNFDFIELNDQEMNGEELELFLKYEQLAIGIAAGEEPRRCNKCDYCRETVKITGPRPVKVAT